MQEDLGLLIVNSGLQIGNLGLLIGNSGLLIGNSGLLIGNSGLLIGNSGLMIGLRSTSGQPSLRSTLRPTLSHVDPPSGRLTHSIHRLLFRIAD